MRLTRIAVRSESPRETAIVQVAPTPPPSLDPVAERNGHPRSKPTAKPPIRIEASAAVSGELSDGSGTRLHSDQVQRPPRPGVCGERSGPGPTRGVARLLAVANLTVKTNIRTARRGTLRGARDSPTMQAGLRGCQACEVLAARRSYVVCCKIRLDLTAQTCYQRLQATHGCMN